MWVMAGMSVIAGVSAYFTFPTDILTTADKRVDWIGAALVTVGLIFIQFSVSAGEAAPQGWATGCECRYPHKCQLTIVQILSHFSFSV